MKSSASETGLSVILSTLFVFPDDNRIAKLSYVDDMYSSGIQVSWSRKYPTGSESHKDLQGHGTR